MRKQDTKQKINLKKMILLMDEIDKEGCESPAACDRLMFDGTTEGGGWRLLRRTVKKTGGGGGGFCVEEAKGRKKEESLYHVWFFSLKMAFCFLLYFNDYVPHVSLWLVMSPYH
jgi:hypothetical protein